MSIPPHPYFSKYALPALENSGLVSSRLILSRAHTVVNIALGYHVLFVISQWLIFPLFARYRLSWEEELDKNSGRYKKKYTDLVNQSAVRLVSLIQALIVLYLSFNAIVANKTATHPSAADRIFKVDEWNVTVCVFAIGYFLWDIYISLLYSTFPFVLHGLISTVVYAIGLKPYINYYAAIFLVFELSNPFLNIRWFGIKYLPQVSEDCQTLAAKFCNVFQLVNNIVLIVMFFLARICWGFYQFYQLCSDFYAVRDSPGFLPVETAIIVVGNLCLDVLNLTWLSTMLSVAFRIIKKGGKVQAK